MAGLDTNRFSCWNNIRDDSPYVHRALATLGFLCEFVDLTTDQMRLTLALADFLKRAEVGAEVWES